MRLAWGDRVAEVLAGSGEASIDGRAVEMGEIVRDAAGAIDGVRIAGEHIPVRTARDGDRVFVWCAGRAYEFRTAPPGGGRPRGRAEAHGLASPMPGRIRKVLVAVGDLVEKGDVLLVLEAMKMEHAIRAPEGGRVVRIAFAEGDLVDAGVELVEIGEAEAPEGSNRAATEDRGPGTEDPTGPQSG